MQPIYILIPVVIVVIVVAVILVLGQRRRADHDPSKQYLLQTSFPLPPADAAREDVTPRDVPPDDGSTAYVFTMARRVIEIADSPTGLSGNENEIRAIGQRLNDRGGMDRMLYLHAVIDQVHHRRPDARLMEMIWDGIGAWRG